MRRYELRRKAYLRIIRARQALTLRMFAGTPLSARERNRKARLEAKIDRHECAKLGW